MKFLILALVALSIGHSECSALFHIPKKSYTFKEVLEAFFDITDKDLNEKCDEVDTDEQSRWYKIGKAIADLHDALLSLKKEGLSVEQAQKNLIKTALPCATEAKVAEKLSVFEKQSNKNSVHVSKKWHTAKDVLEEFFNIKDEDLNEKCDKVKTNEKARWDEIKKAILEFQNAVEVEQNEDPSKQKNSKDSASYKAKINLIKTALPCATEAKVSKSVSFYDMLEDE